MEFDPSSAKGHRLQSDQLLALRAGRDALTDAEAFIYPAASLRKDVIMYGASRTAYLMSEGGEGLIEVRAERFYVSPDSVEEAVERLGDYEPDVPEEFHDLQILDAAEVVITEDSKPGVARHHAFMEVVSPELPDINGGMLILKHAVQLERVAGSSVQIPEVLNAAEAGQLSEVLVQARMFGKPTRDLPAND